MPLRVARCRASRCPLATASQQAVRPSSYMWHTYHIHMAHGTSPPRPGERELTHNVMTLFCTSHGNCDSNPPRCSHQPRHSVRGLDGALAAAYVLLQNAQFPSRCRQACEYLQDTPRITLEL